MKLRSLWCEAIFSYQGPLPARLGSGEDYTLHYGGASSWGGATMLYVKYPFSHANALRRKISKCAIIPPAGTAPGRIDCSERGSTKIAHIGEAHCTIASFELQPALKALAEKYDVPTDDDALKAAGLFDENGNGLKFPLNLKSGGDGRPELLVFSSQSYENIPPGLMAIVAPIEITDDWYKIRDVLGLPGMPRVGPNNYIPHVSLAYAHQDIDIRRHARRQST